VVVSSKPNNFWYYKRLAVNFNYLFKQIPKKLFDEADYFLKIDDDTIIEKDYVKNLIPFLRDGSYGAVSGKILSFNGKEYIHEKRKSDYAIGNAMFFRKELIEYLGGYPMFPSSDTVLNITANYLGFGTRQMDNIIFYQKRLTYVNSGLNQPTCMAVKRYYLRFPAPMVFGLLFFTSGKNVFANFGKYFELVGKVKDCERLDRPELVRANNRRLILIVLKLFRKPFSRWV